jgi:hypothetical protein
MVRGLKKLGVCLVLFLKDLFFLNLSLLLGKNKNNDSFMGYNIILRNIK